MAIHTTIASWKQELQQRKAQTRDSFATTVRKIGVRVGTKIVMYTPILTGRASGSWNVTFGSPGDADLGVGNHAGAKELAISSIASTLAEGITNTNPFRKFYYNNTVPYINKLEHGSSSQAPAGMVRLALLEVRSDMRASLQ